MDKQIIKIINEEDRKNPLTDEAIAAVLQVFREDVTMVRKAHNIPDSRKRRKPVIAAAIKQILADDPMISDRGLTRLLVADGYEIGKYAVAKLKEEILESEQLIPHDGVGIGTTDSDEKQKVFHAFIGYDGSMKTQITRAQAAILYPPQGLHCLIYGPSGVGKSFLAELMHEYACQTENFGKDAPYYAFNCADYADNPQLLLAQLFGYNKGAFTGASDSKKGVVEQCNGGILLLDEVHRLPPEGQEILFYLMDKGKFRRLGEVDIQRESRVMVIAATTENPQSSLLLTFRRRIPMVIEIPPLKDRPAKEKLQFILSFFERESGRLGKQIKIKQQMLWCLLAEDCPGNVGQLKSDIQVCCARAFLESHIRQNNRITITFESLTENLRRGYAPERITSEIKELVRNDWYIFPDNSPVSKAEAYYEEFNIYGFLEEKHGQLLAEGLKEKEIELYLTEEIESRLEHHIDEFYKYGMSGREIAAIVGDEMLRMTRDIFAMAKQRLPLLEENIIFPLAIHLNMATERMKSNRRMTYPAMNNIRQHFARDYEVACVVVTEIRKKYYLTLPEEEIGFLAMYFKRFQKEASDQEGRIAVLVISHGPVAGGMAQVANTIMGTEHAVGLDLNLWDTPEQMAEKVINLVRQIHQGYGCIILADMGSLLSIGQRITEETEVPVRVVARVDTMMVVEAVRKTMWTDETLDEIAEELAIKQVSVPRELSDGSRKKNGILCLCITGQGAAIMLKQHLEERLKSNLGQTTIVTRGYIEEATVSQIIKIVEKEYEILAIVGTIDPECDKYPFVSVSAVYQPAGISRLRKILKRKALFEKNQLSQVISRKNIFVRTEAGFKDEIIDGAVAQMVADGCVKPEFLLSVYKREGMLTTRLSQGIAIPHGDPQHVTKPVISITKLDKPILWDGVNLVDIIFVLALQENSRKYFEQLYQIISDESMISAIRSSESAEEILNLLCKNTKSDK